MPPFHSNPSVSCSEHLLSNAASDFRWKIQIRVRAQSLKPARKPKNKEHFLYQVQGPKARIVL